MQASILDLPPGDINVIKACWEKLSAVHSTDSVYFKDHYSKFTFEKRMDGIKSKNDEDIRLTMVKVGDGVGEIASLYIDEALRGRAYGRKLVDLHKDWFRTRNCRKVIVTVSHGHGSVLGFYHKLGFYERLIELELKE